MLEEHHHKEAAHNFDGIIENRVTGPPVYFNVLFYGLIIWGLLFCAYYLFSGWSSEAEFEEKMAAFETSHQQQSPAPESTAPEKQAAAAPVEETTANAVDGAALYADRCAMCHGADGGGGVGPALNAETYIYGREAEAVRESIANGRENGMPAFGSQLSQAELEALVGYVQAL